MSALYEAALRYAELGYPVFPCAPGTKTPLTEHGHLDATTDPDQILAHVRERNRGVGITLHTIGLSGAQDAYLLRNLAEQNGGIYAGR